MANKKKIVTTVTETVTEEFVNTNEKTQIVCILDRSGSMSSIMDDSIGGFNEFIKQQKDLPDDASLTVAIFDDKYELLYNDVDIKDVEPITKRQWYPRGMTALYDAIGKAINDVKASHAKLGVEAPSKVLVCIVTDGDENASKEYRLTDIEKLISSCEKENWNFMYLAANQDAFAVGSGFGVSMGNTFTYTASSRGVKDMSSTLSDAAVSYRSMDSTSMDFMQTSKSLISDFDGISNTTNTVDLDELTKFNSSNTIDVSDKS